MTAPVAAAGAADDALAVDREPLDVALGLGRLPGGEALLGAQAREAHAEAGVADALGVLGGGAERRARGRLLVAARGQRERADLDLPGRHAGTCSRHCHCAS
ncbi:hypothetical protein [Agrococcus sp. KRD186]|uniref:hypothetical protein n=1 Tax=Agrococcus sp. KRD186 TaxID=2729730 RepID=UPI0019D2C1EF|nr:hypothetical protein [Agrococcus sp. KRD186]